MLRMTTPAFIVELPVRDGDDVSRFLKPKCSFGTQVYNAMLDTDLGRFQRLKESKAWHDAFVLSEKTERNGELTRLRKEAGLTEYGFVTVANNHRNAAKRFIPVTMFGAKGKPKTDGFLRSKASVRMQSLWKPSEHGCLEQAFDP